MVRPCIEESCSQSFCWPQSSSCCFSACNAQNPLIAFELPRALCRSQDYSWQEQGGFQRRVMSHEPGRASGERASVRGPFFITRRRGSGLGVAAGAARRLLVEALAGGRRAVRVL